MAIRPAVPVIVPSQEEVIKQRINAAIRKYAALFSVDPILVAAVIWQESKCNIWASKVEENFYNEKILPRGRRDLSGYVPANLPDIITEKRDRSRSWGLMQLMGETARVLGFRGDYLAGLYEIEVNIEYGCRCLARCLEKANRDQSRGVLPENRTVTEQALIYYNGSSVYPPLVLGHIKSGDYRKVFDERE